MEWKHKCSPDWMQMRQHYLTASDIKRLLPVTPSGRERKVGETEYLRVLASKMRDITDDECMSYGMAARGHLLEPYAIKELNEQYFGSGEAFWWDDKLIPSQDNVLAFSPDGLDISMEDWSHGYDPTAMVEIKCYNEEKHLVTAYSDPMKLEERWQIATGMVVCPSIKKAFLVLYNPDMWFGKEMYVFEYLADDLHEEINMINEIADDWENFKKDLGNPKGSTPCLTSMYRDEIYLELSTKMGVNPV